jgi:methyl-accepting chemotaxis protein
MTLLSQKNYKGEIDMNKLLKSALSQFHKIRSKIIIILVLISFVPVFITGISSYLESKSVLSKKLETTSTQTIREVGRGIDNYFEAMTNLVKLLSNDNNIMEADETEHFQLGKDLIANMHDSDNKILNIYVGTESGMFHSFPDDLQGFDYKATAWYKDSMAQPGKVSYSRPYQDAITGLTVVSITTTIIKNDQPIGVVGIDINLTSLAEQLSDIQIGDSGYIYIVDPDGYFITHKDDSYIGTDTITETSIWKEVSANKEGFTSYDFEGEHRFGSYVTSENTHWKIISSMSLSELTNDTKTIKNTFIAILLIMVFISVLASILFTKPMHRNIVAFVSGFRKLDDGNLTAHVAVKSKDEFSMLAGQFNKMVLNIANIVKNVSSSSANVLDSAAELANIAEETNVSISEVSRAVEEVAHGAAEQAQYSADGASSVSDLASKLNQIEEATNVIDTLSKDTNQLTKQGLSRVEELIQKSDITKTSTAQVSDLVMEMQQSMEKITTISNTIDMITEQTNLLSLNASIEAARTGEAGKGFAVVANEIRKLAEQSKASTVEIKATIDEIQQKTVLSVEAMNQTNNNVREQGIVVDQTQIVFHEIMDAVNNLAERVSEIKDDTSDIAQEKENIVSQIENISAVSEETASASEEVTASTQQIAATMDEITKYAENLKNLADDLKGKVNQFKIIEDEE